MNGLNGTRVLTVKDTPVGRVPGEPYGYKQRLTVTVGIEIEHVTKSAKTVTHTETMSHLDFAMTSAVWTPHHTDWVTGGATVEPLREVLSDGGTFRPGWDADKVAALIDLDDWHLNAMSAGCAHQTVVWEDQPYRRPSLDLTLPCPETGYRYGHAWLLRPLPAGFLNRVRDLFADSDQSRIYDSGYNGPEVA